METKTGKFFKVHWTRILSIFFFVILLGAYAYTFAVPPATKYNAGETLDPNCSPGDPNCSVEIGGSGSSIWSLNGTNAYYNNGNVGIGTNSPTKKLSVFGGVLISGGELGTGAIELVAKDSIDINSGQPRSVAVSGDYTYVISADTLTILNTSNPDDIVYVNSTNENLTDPASIAISGNYAYVVNYGSDLVVYDISDPENILFVTSINTYFINPRDITISGDYAFIADSGNYSVVILDISNPENISYVNAMSSEISPFYVAVSGNYAYVIDGYNGGILIFDISDINNISSMGYLGGVQNYFDGPNSIAVSGNYAYVTNTDNGTLVVINISDPNHIYVVDTITTPHAQYGGVVVSGDYAYVGDAQDSLYVFDISNPNNVSQIDSIANDNIACIVDLAYSNSYVYAIDSCSNSLNIFATGRSSGTSLDVSGGVAIGAYSLNSPAPTNGLIVSGKVGIGTDSPTSMLDIKIDSQINYNQEFYEADGNGDSLDDATYSGTYTGSNDNWIYVWIDGEGSTDTFSYSDDNGDCPEVNNVPITGGVQGLCLGLSIQFENTTGHSFGDEWDYGISTMITNSHPLTIRDSNNIYFDLDIENNGLSVGGVDYILPSSQASSYGQVLKNDGDGYLYWDNDLSSGDSSPISAVGTYGLSTSAWGAGSADFSTFLGQDAGNSAGSASYSNFIGRLAGFGALNASFSNFLGNAAGVSANKAWGSNFFGYSTGYHASNASYSNFLGYGSGFGAVNSALSNFIGANSGYSAANASNSIFIGQNAGFQDTVDNTTNGLSSILIGSFTNTGGKSNSILLGSGTSGSPIANTKANQFMLAPTVTEMRLRGVDYSLPPAQGGAGTVLKNDGNGVLTWETDNTGGGGLLSDADFNTKGGTDAGLNLVAGAQNNTFLGYQAGMGGVMTNAADHNTAIGSHSLYSNTTGSSNTANGYYSLLSNTTGSSNTANGYYSLLSNTTGFQNTAIGSHSLLSNTTGRNNTASGFMSLSANTTGRDNTASGFMSLSANTTGNGNTASGVQSLFGNTTGHINTAIGWGSLYYNITGSNAVAIGSESQMYANDTTTPWTNYNTSVGYQSLRGSTTASNNTGNSNTAIGYQSLFSNTTGHENSALGVYSLYSNTSGFYNTSNGWYSLYSNTTGNQNSAFGMNSMSSNISGNSNSALGVSSLGLNTTGYENSAVGMQSLLMNTTGYYNSALGSGALIFNTTGYNNSALGRNSGKFTTLGGNNETSNNSLYLGYDTRASADGNTNEIVVGYSTIGRGSNTAQWGNTSMTNHYFSGNIQFSTYGAGTLTTDASGNITASSDERLKNIEGDFNNEGNALEVINSINPILYKWNDESGFDQSTIYAGFSAQNIKDLIPEAVGMDKNGFLTLSDRPILATTVNAIKELDLKVKSINDMNIENDWRDSLIAWFSNATNKITRIFTGEICLTDPGEESECINRSELIKLKALISETDTGTSDDTETENDTNIDDTSGDDENGASDGDTITDDQNTDQSADTVDTSIDDSNDLSDDVGVVTQDQGNGVILDEEVVEDNP